MKQAIIDIGSNSIRLTLYETEGEHFKTLFREKIMAGLAGYVENRTLSAAGIECACSALLNFQSILQTLKIDHICVFATASLRNISNTGQARSIIRSVTGYDVEILSGEEEALLGYTGAMQELHLASGAFLDIGGASTEIVTFHDGTPVDFTSFPIGSLSLYRRCVKKILPGASSPPASHDLRDDRPGLCKYSSAASDRRRRRYRPGRSQDDPVLLRKLRNLSQHHS